MYICHMTAANNGVVQVLERARVLYTQLCIESHRHAAHQRLNRVYIICVRACVYEVHNLIQTRARAVIWPAEERSKKKKKTSPVGAVV